MGLIGDIVGTGAAVAGSIFGGNKLREADEMFEKRIAEIKNHRDNIYFRDPTQTAENQAAVAQARELLAEQAKRTAGAAAVAGGTDESAALAKKQGAEAVGKMLQEQAVQGAQQREKVWSDADQDINAFNNYLADSKKLQAQNITQGAGRLTKAASLLPI